MRLTAVQAIIVRRPWNYGGAVIGSGAGRRPATVGFAFAVLALMIASVPATAQQASPSGFDPRQTEKYFDASQFGPTPAARSALQMPRLARSEVSADSKPLLRLRRISLTGARAIPADRLIT